MHVTIAPITAAEYVRPMDSGRTCPLIINCEGMGGSMTTMVQHALRLTSAWPFQSRY